LLKNSKCLESLQIERERRPRRYEPNATRLGSNERREREISRSVQIYKQAKKRVADCTVCTDADVAGRTTRGIQTFEQLAGDLVCLAANGMTTCGPVNGRHMSSIYWFKTYVVGRIRPRDLRAGAKTWQRAVNRHATSCSLLYIWCNIYVCICVWFGARPGRGLAPALGRTICYI
jgi:hypothetical protein